MPDKTPRPVLFLSWKVIYLIVASALALEIAAFSALTWIYR
jgi:hypothetical protein